MTSVANPPRLTADEARQVARALFGVTGEVTPLPSERDQNFRIQAADNSVVVLKIANVLESLAMLEAENAVMAHLAPTGLVPHVIPTITFAPIGRVGDHAVRMVSWINGDTLSQAAWRGEALHTHLGRVVGTIDRTLATFDHPALHRRFYWDLAGAPALMRERMGLIDDAAMRGVIESVLALYQTHVEPRLSTLRTGVIHNDVNDHNVLVDSRAQLLTGIVDFGDMVVSHVVNDLAIAMAYAELGETQPLSAALPVARGYHAEHPLLEDEVAVLFPLMCMRLALSVCVAAVQQAERPGDDYLSISQAPIREALPRLMSLHPRFAHYRLREACGLAPVPHSSRVSEWLREHSSEFASVTGHDYQSSQVTCLDFTAGSPLVSSDPAENATEPFTSRVFDAIRDAGAEVGAGGYNEARLIYASDAYGSGSPTDERRTIHIGLDLTLEAGKPIHAPLDGVVHGFEDAGKDDYGPVIVLRHDIPGETPLSFFTLHGHLTRESLEGLSVGKEIRKAERFAAVGGPAINGGWWPHLHFQVITDMLDIPCNFNGVAPASQRDTWLSLCPDPNLILGIPEDRFPRHATPGELRDARRRVLGRNLSLSYGEHPLNIVRGWMQYLFDETGRRYIDAYNNVPHVGHSHPRVARAVAAQLATLNTNTRYLQEVVVEYAQALTATLPAPLSVCFFTTSGSEANELALRLARAHTGKRDLVVMDAAYHGHTTSMLDASPYKHQGPGGSGAPDWVHVSPLPDVYRGRHKASDPRAGEKYAQDVGDVIERARAGSRNICGYLAETCPSVGGQIMLPPGFLADVYRRVRAAGGLCIADEVQTGFGRVGTHFWAFEQHGVVPDILVLGKPIANGYPMGAVVTSPEIAASFDNGMEFFSTFGGSTAACAAALATLHTTIENGLQAHALVVGNRMLAGLRELQEAHESIGDVRGSGLFIGVELVRDRTTLEPATEEAAAAVNHMRDLGVLTGTDGPHHNVIKLRGPMPLSATDADLVMEALDVALRRAEG